ncbi:hypothetical protein ACJQWK_03008 [Exserohilum turcicum]
MSTSSKCRNLRIIIVGAGIAGVTAAASLRQAGFSVQLLEKSAFAKEVGAAINITPNGARALQALGFDFQRALAYRVTGYEFLHGETFEKLNIVHDTPRVEPGTWAVHRADLHAELMRLACESHDQTLEDEWGPPVELRLASRVRSVASGHDCSTVTLEDGATLIADLIIGADGGTSAVRDYVLKNCAKDLKQTHSGMAAFRYLIEMEKLKADKDLAGWLGRTEGAVTLFADMAETTTEKHIISYRCHGNELQNFVGIHASTTDFIEEHDGLKDVMMQEYSHFHPKIMNMISMASHLKRWPLYIHEPISTWVREGIVLIGDAVHPMLPFSAQGANQAIEDGIALGLVLGDNDENDVRVSLLKFQELRKNRVARVQILSSVRVGRELEVQEKLSNYLDPGMERPPMTNKERCMHDWNYDIVRETKKLSSF